MITLTVYPYKGREERLALTKILKGRIIIEADYILNIVYEGELQ